jgi:hypothetical protein
MKYKIEFTGQAEVLFALVAKLLPDDLHVHVEEVLEAQPQPKQLPKITKMVAFDKLDRRQLGHFRHPSGKTAKDFVLEYLQNNKTGQWRDMNEHIVQLGFSKSTLNNAISRLKYEGKIELVSTGIYKLTDKKAKAS